MTHRNPDGTSEPAAYDFEAIQDKWLPVWDELAPFRAGAPTTRGPRKYVLDMFPYPSGDLHMGHAEAYALGDVVARYWVQRGYNVLHPIGWDSFGLPAENAAIKRGADPRGGRTTTSSSRRRRCAATRARFDWDRVLHTCDPEYYRWNQWLFLRLFERGLAYRKASLVNWCPNDQTVLANEQVVGGRCERCDALGHEEEADAVVLPDHRLRRPAAGRHGPAGGPLAGQGADRCSATGSAAPPVPTSTSRSRAATSRSPSTRRARTRCTARRSSSSPPTPTWRPSWPPGTPAEAEFAAYLEQVQDGHRDRAAVHRAAEDRRVPAPLRDQPGQRRAAADLGRRLRAGRLRHRRDHGGARARPARPGLRPRVRPAVGSSSTPAPEDPRRSTGVADAGRRRRWSTRRRWTGWRKAEAIARDHRRSLARARDRARPP